MYLPAEIWRKIWMYRVVVDEHRSKLLSDIRKGYMIKEIEKQYRNDWVIDGDVSGWLYNDVMLWLNEEKATLLTVTDKLKDFCKRNFFLVIEDNNDIDAMEIFLLTMPYLSMFTNRENSYLNTVDSKKLWNYVVYHLKEDETYWFYKWVYSLRLFEPNTEVISEY